MPNQDLERSGQEIWWKSMHSCPTKHSCTNCEQASMIPSSCLSKSSYQSGAMIVIIATCTSRLGDLSALDHLVAEAGSYSLPKHFCFYLSHNYLSHNYLSRLVLRAVLNGSWKSVICPHLFCAHLLSLVRSHRASRSS